MAGGLPAHPGPGQGGPAAIPSVSAKATPAVSEWPATRRFGPFLLAAEHLHKAPQAHGSHYMEA